MEPQKSPGCQQVPGLFFLISEVRVSLRDRIFHGFTAIWGRSQAGRGWVGCVSTSKELVELTSAATHPVDPMPLGKLLEPGLF